jgi:hypothetical protein
MSLLSNQFTRRAIKLTVVITMRYHCCQYKILFNILLSRLIPYTDEIIGDHQCGFRRNISVTDQITFLFWHIRLIICELQPVKLSLIIKSLSIFSLTSSVISSIYVFKNEWNRSLCLIPPLLLLWHVEQLMGNDSEIRKYTIAVTK